MTAPRRVGVIVPANNAIIEPELYAAGAAAPTWHFARLPTTTMVPEAYRQMLAYVDRAAEDLLTAGVDALLYACLSTSLVQPAGWEEDFTAALAHRTGVPVTTAAQAVLTELRRLSPAGARRVSTISPYPAEIEQAIPGYLARHGITVTAHAGLGVETVRAMGDIDTGRLSELALATRTPQDEALVLLATDIPTRQVRATLEQRLGLPVITTNQALRRAGEQHAGATPGTGRSAP